MAHRIKHGMETTMGKTVHWAAQVGMSGTATGLSCSLLFSTEQHCIVSGTSPGIVTVTMPVDYAYPRLMAWGCSQLTPGTTGTVAFGGNFAGNNVGAQYNVVPRVFQYPSGSALADGTDLRGNSTNATRGGGAVFQVAINQLQVKVTGNVAAGNVTTISGTIVDPVDSSVGTGSPVATLSFWADFRDSRQRSV